MFTTIDEADIIALLNSDDWKERLRGEYYELRLRYETLKAANIKADIRFRTDRCYPESSADDLSRILMRDQQDAMDQYLHILELRAELAGITLCVFDE